MKKSMFLVIVILFSVSAFAQYPGQSTDNDSKADVSVIETYIDEKPVVFKVGNVKWIHDPRNKSFLLFKGETDSVLLKILNWLSRTTDDTGALATPVVKITGSSVSLLTLFTRKELSKQENKRKVLELTKSKIYVVTIPNYTYVEDFDDVEYARYKGIKVVPVTTPSNQPAPAVVEENKKQKPTRSSAFKPRVKYPRN